MVFDLFFSFFSLEILRDCKLPNIFIRPQKEKEWKKSYISQKTFCEANIIIHSCQGKEKSYGKQYYMLRSK